MRQILFVTVLFVIGCDSSNTPAPPSGTTDGSILAADASTIFDAGGSDLAKTTTSTCIPLPGAKGNSFGIGQYCKANSDCTGPGNGKSTLGLACAAVVQPSRPDGTFCLQIGGCMADADCGTDAACVDSNGKRCTGGVSCQACIPAACVQ